MTNNIVFHVYRQHITSFYIAVSGLKNDRLHILKLYYKKRFQIFFVLNTVSLMMLHNCLN